MQRIYQQAGRVLALAALGSTGAAHAYEWQINEDTLFSVYGTIELGYVNQQRAVDDDPEDGEPAEVDGVRELYDNGSTLGFEGEHAFNDSLTGYFRAEFEYRADEKEGDEGIADTDEIFVGVEGPLGAVQVGTWDGIYEDNVEDLLDVFEYGEPTNSEDFRTGEVGDSVAYFSPEFAGFSFAVQGFFKGAGEGEDFDGDPDADDGQAFQAVARYEMERYVLYLGYDDNGLSEEGEGTFGLGGTVDLAPFALSAKVESVGENPLVGEGEFGSEGYMLYGLAGEYDYGPGSIIAAVNQVDPEQDSLDGRTELGLNVNYAIAENFYIYAEHLRFDAEDDLGNYTAVGTVYAF